MGYCSLSPKWYGPKMVMSSLPKCVDCITTLPDHGEKAHFLALSIPTNVERSFFVFQNKIKAYTIQGLEGGVKYYVRISAENNAGTGSVTYDFITPPSFNGMLGLSFPIHTLVILDSSSQLSLYAPC